MTVSKGLFVRQTGAAPNAVGTTPLEARLALAGLVAEQSPGVPRSGLLLQSTAQVVTGSSTDMSYNVAACNPVINRTAGEGVYIFSLTGTSNVSPGTAAPGTGSRYDLIYVRQHDPDKGDADNLPELGVVVGQSSTGTPTKPYASVPAGGYVLAEAQIFAGTTAANGGTNVMTQVWRHTATRGAVIPVLSATDQAGITGAPVGSRTQRLDLRNNIDVWNGTAWVPAPEPRGLLTRLSNTSNSGTIGSGFVVVNNVASFTFKGGRKYRIGWDFAFQTAAANAPVNVLIATCPTTDAASLTTDLTQLNGRVVTTPVASQNATDQLHAIYEPAADTTLQVKWVCNSPNSNAIFTAAATNPNYFTIEDLGAQY